MFGKNTYLQFPQVSASHHHSRVSTSVLELNGTSAAELFLHHHPEFLSGHFLTANAPVLEAAALFNQESGGHTGDPAAVPNTFQKKQAVSGTKKDRHSKIYTSQGPRDRRVRLSIGIARKFFDLQEMLGFDKPSKTLDWLLTKSKTAIKELVQAKCSKSRSSPSEGLSEGNGNGEISEQSLLQGTDLKGKSVMYNSINNKSCHKGALKDPQQAAAANLAKESRAKARARARERTKEKMCIKQMNEARNKGSDWNPSIPIHSCSNQYEVSNSSHHSTLHCPVPYEDLIHETMKRKTRNPSVFGFQQNFGSSRDFTISSGNGAAENWDYNTFTSQSSLCAILDQHKFMN